jgi:tRNA (guanosine-2'-O-)-methyltransferase
MSDNFETFLRECVSDNRLQRFEEVLEHRTRHLTVVLENIYDPFNASACLRTCDCFGVQDVHVIESRNEFNPNPDIALGASKWLTIHRYASHNAAQDDINKADQPPSPPVNTATADCFSKLRADGYRILTTSPRQDSTPLKAVSVTGKTAIVLGAEQVGVSEFAIAEADDRIHIPMFGFTESFNISVSAAIILQQITSHLHASEISWQLTDLEKQAIRELWVRKTLRSRYEPLRRRFEYQQQKQQQQQQPPQ